MGSFQQYLKSPFYGGLLLLNYLYVNALSSHGQCRYYCKENCKQGHPTGNFEKKTWKQQQSMKPFFSILPDCWEKCICSLLPATLLEEFPASKVNLQPATWLTGKFSQQMYVQILPASLSVVTGQNSALQVWGGRGEKGGAIGNGLEGSNVW